MGYATDWEASYDQRTADVVAAALAVSLEPSPRIWPISGATATRFNPGGHVLSEAREPKDPLGTRAKLQRP